MCEQSFSFSQTFSMILLIGEQPEACDVQGLVSVSILACR
jgi:hypothetical protein